MGLLYVCGFRVTSSSPGSMTLSTLGTGATISAGYYLAGNLGTSTFSSTPSVAYSGQAYTPFATAIKTAFDAATGTTFTVTWSSTTGLYTITRATTFTLTFSTAADLRLRDALGFTANRTSSFVGGVWTLTSDVVPAYVLDSTIAGRTNVTGPYEPDDIAEETVSDGGDAYVITRKTSELLIEWQQSMEPRSKVMTWAAYVTNSNQNIPWSYQQMFRHLRGTYPFFVDDDLTGEANGVLYQLTARGASFRPRRVTADYDDQWIIPFEARWLARSS